MTSNSTELEIEQLRKTVEQHNRTYYLDSAPTISDVDYDALMQRLLTLEAEHPELASPTSPSLHVGRDRNDVLVQVAHKQPMLSLSNTCNYDEIAEICKRTDTLLTMDNVPWMAEMRHDGSSISLVYEEGMLARVVTRGDGTFGDDVTVNVRTIQSVSLHLHSVAGRPDYTKGHTEVRDEVLLPFKEFERLNGRRTTESEAPFANPRGAAASTLKTLNSRIVAQRRLFCICYCLCTLDSETRLPDSYYERIKLLEGMGFDTGVTPFKNSDLSALYHYIDEWDVQRGDLLCAMDGIVLKVDNLTQQRVLGNTAKLPRWAFACKYQPEDARAELLSMDYQMGRSGIVTPVANVGPVLISGTMVRRATLHNGEFIKSLDLHYHGYVYIGKDEEIIPGITAVGPSPRRPEAEPVRLPERCPAYSTPLQQIGSSVGYYCVSSYACPPQIMGRIEHYCTRRAADINVGPETIDALFDKYLIENIDDLYKLTASDLAQLPNFKEKSISNLLASIERSKGRPFARLLYNIGIRFVSEDTAETLTRHFQSIDRLAQTTAYKLQALPGVGPRVVEQVVYSFSPEHNQQLIAELQHCGVRLEEYAGEATNMPQSDRLEGERIVISGSFTQHSRNEYRQPVEQHGGTNVGSTSSRATFILMGSDIGPSKRAKAEQLGIPFITEEEFLACLSS